MSVSLTAIAIVAIVTSAIVRLARIRAGTDRWSRRELRHGWPQQLRDLAQTASREQELQKELEALQERVKVLERIATDERGTRALAQEIESLRNH